MWVTKNNTILKKISKKRAKKALKDKIIVLKGQFIKTKTHKKAYFGVNYKAYEVIGRDKTGKFLLVKMKGQDNG